MNNDLLWPTEYPPVPEGYIGISYICGSCSDERKWLCIRERFPGEDVRACMSVVTTGVKAHHSITSPECDAQVIRQLAIPMSGRPNVGGPRVQ